MALVSSIGSIPAASLGARALPANPPPKAGAASTPGTDTVTPPTGGETTRVRRRPFQVPDPTGQNSAARPSDPSLPLAAQEGFVLVGLRKDEKPLVAGARPDPEGGDGAGLSDGDQARRVREALSQSLQQRRLFNEAVAVTRAAQGQALADQAAGAAIGGDGPSRAEEKMAREAAEQQAESREIRGDILQLVQQRRTVSEATIRLQDLQNKGGRVGVREMITQETESREKAGETLEQVQQKLSDIFKQQSAAAFLGKQANLQA